jgi:hypothetical protein
MGTTTNNGWTYPESTDLVKDGATAIETLATNIDTTLGVYADPGLVLLNTTSFSAVASQSLPTDTFTATYSHYRIMLSVTTTATNSDLFMRLRAAGTDNTANNYMWAGRGFQSSGSTFDKNSAGATSSFVIGVSKTDGPASWVIDIFNPKAAFATSYSSFGQWRDGATAIVELPIAGGATVTTSYDSVTIFGGGNLTGTLSCYGYNI